MIRACFKIFLLGWGFIFFEIPASAKATQKEDPPDFRCSLPLGRLSISSGFGWRIHPVTGRKAFHRGIDLVARNAPVFSILDGKIQACGYHAKLGNYVIIAHGSFQSIYAHLSRIVIQPGAHVTSGQLIGVTGASGLVTGEHLHFAIRDQCHPINPLRLLYLLYSYSRHIITSNNDEKLH
jgi:murein DD-endopeptidase MepM/ murein hydrolase activator NlpD